MKRIISFMLIMAMVGSIQLPAMAEDNLYKEFYVSVNGSDENPGTKDKPFKTIEAAKQAVRTVNKDMTGDIAVNIESGNYYLDDQLLFETEDSGFNGHRVIYRGVGDSKPVVSGGTPVTGFRKSEYEDIWEADLDIDSLLTLSVNGEQRNPAKSASMVKAVQMPAEYLTSEYYEAHPEVDKERKYDYNDLTTDAKYDAFFISKRDFGMYENPQDVYLQWQWNFITRICMLDKIVQPEKYPDLLLVYPSQAMWAADFAEKTFMVCNAFELLDEPGEFYYNKTKKKLYYIPEKDEDMTTATVVAPRLDTIVLIDGNDIDDKVKNLTFDNIKFSDTKMNHGSSFSGQAVRAYSPGGIGGSPTSMIEVKRSSGLEITNSIVCNAGGQGICLRNAVDNSVIKGNAVYDIGATGISVGQTNHNDICLGWTGKNGDNYADKIPTTDPEDIYDTDGVSDPVPEDKKDAAFNLIFDEYTRVYSPEWSTGYRAPISDNWPNPDHNNTNAYEKLHINYITGDYSDMGTSVFRDTESKKRGLNSYYAVQFNRPYTLDEITVSFNPDLVNPGENADYEILASNDITFKEGSYKVIATQNGEAPEAVNHYKVNDDEKYSCVMIRKTTPGDFALSRIWVSTYDRKPFVKNERCTNFDIENNIIERAGARLGHSIGLCVVTGVNGTILHNEIKDMPYSGISIGYTWGELQRSTENIELGYNYLYDVVGLMHDGGGIYNLGPSRYSNYHNNRIERVNIGINSIYCDNGTRFIHYEENYMENSNYTLALFWFKRLGGVLQNSFKNNFGTHVVNYDDAKSWSDWEDPYQEVIGQPSKMAYDTYANAGLEPEYAYIRDYVTDQHNNWFFRYDYRKREDTGGGASTVGTFFNAQKQELAYTLENAKFGTGLGMYPLESKQKLAEMSEYLAGGSNADQTMRSVVAKDFATEFKKTLNRYSLSDTKKLCEDTLTLAEGENSKDYPKTAVTEFKNSVEKAKSMPTSTGAEQYDALIAYETAYNKLMENKYSDKIIYATMPEATGVDINEDEATVTIYVPKDASLKTDKLEITTEGNSKVGCLLDGMQNLEKGIRVPVYNKGTKKYKIWFVKAEYENTSSNTAITKDTGWAVNTNETDAIVYGTDSVNLPAGQYALMSEVQGGDNQVNMTFKPLTNHDENEFTLILGANKSEEYDYGNTDKEYNRCEIVFKDDIATFCKVDGGNKKVIDKAVSKIKWNEKNDLTYEMKEINNNTHIKVYLNGELLFSEVIVKCSYGRYAGFYTPYLNINVY